MLFWTVQLSLLAAQVDKTILKVALYKSLPDVHHNNLASMQHRIEAEFAQLYPEVELQLYPMDGPRNFYNADDLRWLLDNYHVVEMDSSFQDLFVSENRLQSWPLITSDLTISESIYGLPHWLCTYFAFHRDPSISGMETLSEIKKKLKKIGITMNPFGQYTSLHIMAQTWYSAALEEVDTFIDRLNTINFVVYASSMPNRTDYNSTSDYRTSLFAYAQSKKMEFQSKAINYYIGTSESLADLDPNMTKKDTIFVNNAPWGHPNSMLFMVDSFFLSSRTPPSVVVYARAFTDYMQAVPTYEWIILGEDTESIPKHRYLIPATKASQNHPAFLENKAFRRILSIVNNSRIVDMKNLYKATTPEIGYYLQKISENTLNNTFDFVYKIRDFYDELSLPFYFEQLYN